MADLPPPSYTEATGRHATQNGIPPQRRRSMEDEYRPLPVGWVRQFDPESEHQFFVDTTADPPRSIWHHPHDDETYLKSLTREERDHVTRLHRSVSLKDIEAESSDDEHGHHGGSSSTAAKRVSQGAAIGGASSSSSSRTDPAPTGIKKFGRKLKDRVTNSTHEERLREREQRAREEEEAYKLHLAFRKALATAIQTGQPQYLGKDRSGKDIYIQPPDGPMPVRAHGIPGGAMGYSPYSQGSYTNPNARFLRPSYPYQRPYGYGYGGGYGLPIAGGLLGGALLGGMLF